MTPSNDNSPNTKQHPFTGRWLPDHGLPYSSRWECLKQELHVLWLRLAGRVDRDE
jgi:hypothetical protein